MRNRVPRGATERLEPDEGKLSRTVLRGGGGGNALPLTRLAAHAARRRENRNTSAFVYAFIMPVGAGNNYRAKCHVGPGDEGEPVVTVMRPEED